MRIARGHALGKDAVKEVLEHSGRVELARATDSRMPREVLVDFVAEKIEHVEP